MPEKVVCGQCGATYTDPESIELAKKWIADGYAPCPNISCRGQLELKQDAEKGTEIILPERR